MLISIVIPVYNSEENIPNLYERICVLFEGTEYRYEIIMVNDYSQDCSWEKIKQVSLLDENVIGVNLTKNFGQHAATLCGIRYAQGDWIVTIDDDLEQDPQDIFKLLKKAESGYSLVYGFYNERTHSLWRNLTSSFARKMFSMAIPNLNSNYTSFRVIKNKTAKKLLTFKSPSPFIDGYLSWITNEYTYVIVSHRERYNKKSNYNFRKLLAHTINIFVAFSDIPLKIATWVGLMCSFFGLFFSIILLIGKLSDKISVSGYTSLMVIFLLFGGVQLIMMGVLGEYIGRINFKTANKPLYLVSETVKKAT